MFGMMKTVSHCCHCFSLIRFTLDYSRFFQRFALPPDARTSQYTSFTCRFRSFRRYARRHLPQLPPLYQTAPVAGTVRNVIASHRISFYRISLYRISFYRISLYRISFYRISLYRISLYRISLYRQP
jgi:hypothetical protein